MITSYATSSRYRMMHSSEIKPLSGSGCARGCRLWAGPSGLAALSSGRAEGRSGLRARRCLPPETVFLMQDWGSNALDLLLILEDNYKLTTNKFTTETQSAQRTHRDFSAERSVASCKL